MPRKSKKGDKESKISYYEASLRYKISLKKAELEELNRIVNDFEDKIINSQQRNSHLKDARENTMQKALQEYKTLYNKNDDDERLDKEDVLKEWQQLWAFKRQQENELNAVKAQIRQLDSEISKVKKEIKLCNEYKIKGRYTAEDQIKLLKQQMQAMVANFEVMKNHLINDVETTKEHISKTTEELIAKQHKSTAERIFKEMDKNTVQMMHDNKWMEEKIELYIEESKSLEKDNNELEIENIQLMDKLFKYNLADLRVTKSAFQNQFVDNDNLQKHSILDVDLEEFNTIRTITPSSNIKITDIVELERNKTQEGRDLVPHNFKFQNELRTSIYKNRTTYEMKTLGLQGLQKAICLPKTPKEIFENEARGDEWPITQDMLQLKFQI